MLSNQKATWLLGCALFVTPLAFGLDQQKTMPQQQMHSSQQSTQMHSSQLPSQSAANIELTRASKLIGHEVVDSQGHRLGTIKDVVLDKSGNRIAYVAFSHGGVAGMGNSFLAIPWSEYTVSALPENQHSRGISHLFGDKNNDFRVMLSISQDQLKNVTGFRDDGYWPTQANANWRQGASQSDRNKDTKSTLNRDIIRLSQLLGKNVISATPLQMTSGAARGNESANTMNNRNEQTIGELRDVALAQHSVAPLYGEVSLNRDFQQGQNVSNSFRSIVPWSALRFTMDNSNNPQISLNVPDRQTLLAYGYDSSKEENMPTLGEQQYAQRIYTAYHQQPDWETLGFVSPMPSSPSMQSQTGINSHSGTSNLNQPNTGSHTGSSGMNDQGSQKNY